MSQHFQFLQSLLNFLPKILQIFLEMNSHSFCFKWRGFKFECTNLCHLILKMLQIQHPPFLLPSPHTKISMLLNRIKQPRFRSQLLFIYILLINWYLFKRSRWHLPPTIITRETFFFLLILSDMPPRKFQYKRYFKCLRINLIKRKYFPIQKPIISNKLT